jgi:ABC-type transport system substrate-binding protein
MPNTTSQVVALQSGQIGIMFPDVTATAALKGSRNIVVVGLAGCGTQEIWMNNTGPLANISVRRAVALALNRQEIAQQAFLGQAVPSGRSSPCYGWAPPASKTPFYTQNIPRAKQLLASAGYPNGLTLNINAIAGRGAADEQNQAVIAAQLAKVGITANIQIVDDATWLSRFLGHNYDLTSFFNFYRTNPVAVLNMAGRVGRFSGGLPPDVVASQNVLIGDPNPSHLIGNLVNTYRVQVQGVFPGVTTVSPKVYFAYRKDKVRGVIKMDGTQNMRFLLSVIGS